MGRRVECQEEVFSCWSSSGALAGRWGEGEGDGCVFKAAPPRLSQPDLGGRISDISFTSRQTQCGQPGALG